jgi:hypothetical protein
MKDKNIKIIQNQDQLHKKNKQKENKVLDLYNQ